MSYNIFSRKFWFGKLADTDDQQKSGEVELFMRVFREYFRRFRSRYIVIFALVFVVSASAAAPAILMETLVNDVFTAKQSHLVLPVFLAIMGVFLIKGFATYFQTILSAQISNAMIADVQQRMFDHILSQKSRFFSNKGSDDLLMRFNQGAQGFQSVLNIVVIDGSRDLGQVLVAVGVMIWYDPVLTFVCLVVAPVIFFGIDRLMKLLKGVAEQELAGLASLNKYVRETVQGLTVVKAFNLEPKLRSQITDVIEGVRDRRDRIAQLQAVPVPLLDTVGGIAVGLAILYAGYGIIGGSYDLGKFTAFVTALLLAADPGRRLSRIPVKLKAAFAAIRLVFDLLNEKETEESGSQKLPVEDGKLKAPQNGAGQTPLIGFQDVVFSYDGETPILSGFSLDIHEGEMIALVGPSGAGKSTILKLLLKLHEPESGVISIAGYDQKAIDLMSLRDVISYVGQTNFIFSGTIKDNLVLQNEAVEQQVIEDACRKVGLHDFISAMPQGYDTDVGELGSMISGGQAQRLNMARAIIKDAPILLLDEVTSALDAENEQLIKDYVQSQVGKKTIVVIAHRLSTIQDATRIALVDKGVVVDVGAHEQLLASNDYYEKIVALQFSQ